LEKRKHGRIHGLSNFLGTPNYLRNGQSYEHHICWNIHGVHPNKSPLIILEKMKHGHIQGLPNFVSTPLLSQERVKLPTSNFVRTFIGTNGTKVHYKFRESSRGSTQGFLKIFMAPIYKVHRAVIFAIAQLSCFICVTFFCFCFFNPQHHTESIP